MSQMLKSSGAMAAATLTSRVLGMVREMVYAAFMGNGAVASAFILAFQVPNLFRRLLGEGALTAAFIPIFKQKEVKEGESRNVALGQRGDLRAGDRRRGGDGAGGAGHLAGAGRRAVRGRDATDAPVAAFDVSLHAAGVPGGGVHRHGQRARPLFCAGAGRGRSQRGDDCQRAVPGPAHGTPPGGADLRPRHRGIGGRPGPGLLPVAEPVARRLPL